MKVNLLDSKLRKHFVVVADDSVSIAHVRELLEQKFPVSTGFFPQLVYQKQILTGQDSLRSIGYIPNKSISIVCIRTPSTPSMPFVALAPPPVPSSPVNSTKFDITLLEVTKANLRDAFLKSQPVITRAVKAIFQQYERKFGMGNWLSKFASYLGPSMQAFAVDDDRRVFDMCVICVQFIVAIFFGSSVLPIVRQRSCSAIFSVFLK